VEIKNLVIILNIVSGLGEGLAKACIYYAGVTHKIKDFIQMPILEIIGPTATGKSQILKFLERICFKPHRCEGCYAMTYAVLRDELKKANGSTFIGDEADITSTSIEGLFGLRCSPTGGTTIKRAGQGGQWSQEAVPIFGATVLHHRRAFLDQSNQNRAIPIRTSLKVGAFSPMESFSDLEMALPEMPVGDVPKLGTGRAYDTWHPLLAMASGAGDDDWISWAKEQIEEANSEVRDGQDFEPVALMLAKVIDACTCGDKLVLDNRPRVEIESQIVKPLKESLPGINAYSVSSTLKNVLKLEVIRVGGRNCVYPTEKSLREAAEIVGYRDEVLN